MYLKYSKKTIVQDFNGEGTPLRINVAKKEVIELVLKRKKWNELGADAVDLKQMFRAILKWANELVPSESGSILLDNPLLKDKRQKQGRLYFVACYGKASRALAGASLPTSVGIVGRTYTRGKPYISRNVKKDRYFFDKMDKKTKFQTKSIICAPVEIRGAVIGVIELINRLGRINYDSKDLTLLKIFAGYTSTLVQNSLDAKRFRDLSIMDNLTGLYNDRYLYNRLAEDIRCARDTRGDLSLIFLDIDRFKDVNDTYGHLAGSHLLSELGAILMSFPDRDDILPARYGGDEFVIILPSTDIHAAEKFAERLKKTLDKYVFFERKVPGTSRALKLKGVITCSMGISSLKTIPGSKTTVKHLTEALIKRADIAMYASKHLGRNRITLATDLPTPS
jgi:diguanylate cyclase (GGDEF)-like protein